MPDLDDEELLAALGVEVAAEQAAKYTPREERIIAGFEDIQRFVAQHGRAPQHGEGPDIFERLYAVRLDRIRALEECKTLLQRLDVGDLLTESQIGFTPPSTDDELLAALGVADVDTDSDIRHLQHVRSNAERRAADEIANRVPCPDFEVFRPLFVQVQKDLELGTRETRAFNRPESDADVTEIRLDEIKVGAWFIIGGQKAYIASVGDEIRQDYDRRDARLRVIYDNGTEAELLMRSFQRSLYRDPAARLITEPAIGPLFDAASSDSDLETGTIYILRSLTDNPTIADNRDLIHKIGVTGGKVESRIANAKLDATFLLADVEVVATYELFNINRSKLENLIHRFLLPARFEIEIADRFGNLVKPREWFLVPIQVLDELVSCIRDGSITRKKYDPTSASIIDR